ncbi:hypothetical protein AAC387_Pa03g0678 [Persea americana]
MQQLTVTVHARSLWQLSDAATCQSGFTQCEFGFRETLPHASCGAHWRADQSQSALPIRCVIVEGTRMAGHPDGDMADENIGSPKVT